MTTTTSTLSQQRGTVATSKQIVPKLQVGDSENGPNRRTHKEEEDRSTAQSNPASTHRDNNPRESNPSENDSKGKAQENTNPRPLDVKAKGRESDNSDDSMQDRKHDGTHDGAGEGHTQDVILKRRELDDYDDTDYRIRDRKPDQARDRTSNSHNRRNSPRESDASPEHHIGGKPDDDNRAKAQENTKNRPQDLAPKRRDSRDSDDSNDRIRHPKPDGARDSTSESDDSSNAPRDLNASPERHARGNPDGGSSAEAQENAKTRPQDAKPKERDSDVTNDEMHDSNSDRTHDRANDSHIGGHTSKVSDSSPGYQTGHRSDRDDEKPRDKKSEHEPSKQDGENHSGSKSQGNVRHDSSSEVEDGYKPSGPPKTTAVRKPRTTSASPHTTAEDHDGGSKITCPCISVPSNENSKCYDYTDEKTGRCVDRTCGNQWTCVPVDSNLDKTVTCLRKKLLTKIVPTDVRGICVTKYAERHVWTPYQKHVAPYYSDATE
jgi:hypothetical protein